MSAPLAIFVAVALILIIGLMVWQGVRKEDPMVELAQRDLKREQIEAKIEAEAAVKRASEMVEMANKEAKERLHAKANKTSLTAHLLDVLRGK